MRKTGKRWFVLLALLVLIGLLSLVPRLVIASQWSDSPLPEPVSPEPYPNTDIYPAQVYLPTQADLQLLYVFDIDIGGLQAVAGSSSPLGTSFKPSIATIYVNPSQSDALAKAGLSLVPIPNEGYRSFLVYGPGSGAPDAWPTFEEYVTRMLTLEFTHSNIVDLVSIGKSVQNRDLWCMEITDNPGVDEYEPEFKYSANHHGDETTGIEMTMRLAELLAGEYGVDPDITALVDKMEIWLCPIYNPDGYVAGTRYNAHGQDLNRDFPDRFTDPIDNPAGREPETQAFMNFGYQHRFVMGANYHGGAQVFNYPFDAVANPYNPINAPDDKLFYDFGKGYTWRNPDLWCVPPGCEFDYGLTRGWEWYMIYGGMQDWAYYYHDEHHVTIEVSPYSPPFNQMDLYWEHNRDAMLWWMQRASTGLGGLVLDARNSEPLDAMVKLVDEAVPNTILTDPDVGDYHRVIAAGTYILEASAEGYIPQTTIVNVISDTLTITDFFLELAPDLSHSTKQASASEVLPVDQVQYQLSVVNLGQTVSVTVTDTLPVSLTWSGELTATQGIPTFEDGHIRWQGDVAASQPVTITYGTTVTQCLSAGTSILNIAEFDDGLNGIITGKVTLQVVNASPTIPSSPLPVDSAIGQPITTTLSWAPSTDLNCDLVTYDLAFGTTPTPGIVATGLTAPNYSPGPLLPGMAYYWQVTAKDGFDVIPGPVWSFTTQELSHRTYMPLTLR